jgi:predicted transposase YdaD
MKEAISWCMANDVLKGFFETNATEVINMLMTEWNWDDAFAVQREEGREEGWMDVAKNALTEGLPVEVIHKITGLDMETIKSLAAQ